MQRIMLDCSRYLWLVAILGLSWPGMAAASTAPVAAPTRLFAEPNVYGLIKLPGDQATFHYTLGHLDRAARLQFKIEPMMRNLSRWTKTNLEINVYIMSRQQWRDSRFSAPYGLPVRVGRRGLAAPADGDDHSVDLWQGATSVPLPSSQGLQLGGTPQQASSLMMADIVSQIQAVEIVVDEASLAGNEFWVRGLMTHIALTEYLERYDEATLRDLDLLWRDVRRSRADRSLAAADFRSDMTLSDWMWFQAQFHFGAKAVFEKEGRGSLKKMLKLRRKNGGVITGAAMLDAFRGVNEWYYATFSSISTQSD